MLTQSSGFVPPLFQPYSSSLELLCSWSCRQGLCQVFSRYGEIRVL